MPDPMPSTDWDAFLAQLDAEPPVAGESETTGWLTLAEASESSGVSISALRAWYRSGDIPSRLAPGPHGEVRLVPLDAVLDKALASPRIRNKLLARRTVESEVAELTERVERLEALVQRLLDRS